MQNPLKSVFAKLNENPVLAVLVAAACVFLVILSAVAIFNHATMDNSSRPGTGMMVVEITHSFGLASSSGIKFSCTSARIDYTAREVVMSGVSQIGSIGGSGWVVSFSMQGDQVVVQLDSDEKYKIHIGKIRCTLE